MQNWKVFSILVVGLLLVLLLAPSRSMKEEDTGGAEVVEITYMGPGGPLAGPMDDSVMAFEHESLEAHKKDSSRPVYRVISGQSGQFSGR